MKRIAVIIFVIFNLFLLQIGNVFANDTVTLKKCVDGDTAQFVLDGEIIKVRFLAIDTPESVHPTKEVETYGKEASEYTCNILTNAKVIELEYEDTNKTDKYGRYLAWVWADNILVQDALISNGYAEVAYIYGDYKYTDLLRDHQAIAEAKKLNIWSDKTPNNTDNTNVEKGGSSTNQSFDTKTIIICGTTIFGLYFLYKKNLITKKELKKNLKKLTK